MLHSCEKYTITYLLTLPPHLLFQGKGTKLGESKETHFIGLGMPVLCVEV